MITRDLAEAKARKALFIDVWATVQCVSEFKSYVFTAPEMRKIAIIVWLSWTMRREKRGVRREIQIRRAPYLWSRLVGADPVATHGTLTPRVGANCRVSGTNRARGAAQLESAYSSTRAMPGRTSTAENV